jgi:hypothetical protein
MSETPNKRKKFLINPPFQISIIRQMLILTCVVIAIFYGANIYHFWSLRRQGLSLGLPPEHVFFRFLAEQQYTMDLLFLFTSVLAFLTIVGFGLFLSHRIAGPLYRLKQYLHESHLDPNNTEALCFRENDYFPDVAEAVNLRLGKKPKDPASSD